MAFRWEVINSIAAQVGAGRKKFSCSFACYPLRLHFGLGTSAEKSNYAPCAP
jgi:hypothetical protein